MPPPLLLLVYTYYCTYDYIMPKNCIIKSLTSELLPAHLTDDKNVLHETAARVVPYFYVGGKGFKRKRGNDSLIPEVF